MDDAPFGEAGVDRLRKLRDLPPPPSPWRFVSGETFLYLGRQYRLRVEVPGEPKAGVRLQSGWLTVGLPAETSDEARPALIRKALLAWYRRHAAERGPERVTWWSERLALHPAGVLIRSQEKRWASCDPAGALRFNWRIIHPDHTPAYWAALGQALPDYEDRRDALRKAGARLVW